MDLSQLVLMPPAAFARLLEEDYFDCNGIYIIKVYNALIRASADKPLEVALLAEAAVDTYIAQGKLDEAILYLELQVRAELGRKAIETAIHLLERIADMEHARSEPTILELADDILANVDCFGVSIDQRPRVMSLIATFLGRYEQSERIAQLYLEAALLYSRHGAPHAACRCVADAKGIADSKQELRLLACCHFTMLAISCEAQVYAEGVDAGKLGLEIHEHIGKQAPGIALANMGVAYMNLDEPEMAIHFYDRALLAEDLPANLHFHVRTNYSICLRRSGRLNEASTMVEAAKAGADQGAIDPEGLLELALSGAKIAEMLRDVPLLIERLHEVVAHLDQLLKDVLRLHHRRGLRARYFWRIEELLYALPPCGPAVDSLAPILALRGNAMGDWLTILAWAANAREDRSISPHVVDQMDAVLQAIRDIGAPHLFGMHEQMDDAWNQSNSAKVWDDLSHVGALVYSDGNNRPLDLATAQHHSDLCLTRLKEHHCLMVMTYTTEEALLWYFIGDKYRRIAIPLEALKAWSKAQLDHAQQFLDRAGFTRALSEIIQRLAPLIDPIFEKISDSACKSVRFLEDRHTDLPLMAFALRNTKLTERMQDGDFELRMVPALVEQAPSSSKPLRSTVSIVDPQGDLLLAPFEADAFTKAAGLPPPAELHSDGKGRLLDMMGMYDILIVSTHGHSLKFFQDAYFAHLGNPNEPHLISVSSMQAAAPDLRFRLALLNTCYSGSRSTRNIMGQFKTSDSVAIPNLFLLNRQAVALAGAWKVFDIVSFVISHLVGESIKLGLEPSAALTRSTVRLKTIRRSDVEEELKSSVPLDVLKRALQALCNASEERVFSAPYHTAGLTIHGLL